jgi:hypothetical protein
MTIYFTACMVCTCARRGTIKIREMSMARIPTFTSCKRDLATQRDIIDIVLAAAEPGLEMSPYEM